MIISIVAIIIFGSFCIDLLPNVTLDTKFKLMFYVVACILVFIDMKIKNKKLTQETDKEQNRKKYVTIIFIIYFNSNFIVT